MSGSLVLPSYGEGCLSDLLPSVLAALGVDGESDVVGLPPARAYVVLLVDGLGWRQLRQFAHLAPFLTTLPGRSLTSPVPSTTATSITSLGTGLPPGRHGLVGYQSRLPGTTTLLNALDWDPSVDPAAYQPYPDMFTRARAAGIATAVVSKRRFARSGLTRVALSGAPYRPADTTGERVAAVEDVLRAARGSPALVYAYESDLDGTGHRHGTSAPAWQHQLAATDALAQQLAEAMEPECVLLVTGDHGMVDVVPDDQIDLDAIPALRQDVILIGGEARMRHVYTRAGAADEVADRWARALGERVLVRTQEQAQREGWFGPVEDRVRERIGDVLVAGLGHTVCLVPSVWPREKRMRGHHGSLTDEEMLVPCLLAGGGSAG